MDFGIIEIIKPNIKDKKEIIKFGRDSFVKNKDKDGYLEFEDRPIIEIGNERIHPLWGLIYFSTIRFFSPELTANDFFTSKKYQLRINKNKDKSKLSKYGDYIDNNIRTYTYTYVRIYEHKLGDNPEEYKGLLEKIREIEKFIDKQIKFFKELEKKLSNKEQITTQYILENTLFDKDWFKNTFKTYLLLRGISFPNSQINDKKIKPIIDNLIDNITTSIINYFNLARYNTFYKLNIDDEYYNEKSELIDEIKAFLSKKIENRYYIGDNNDNKNISDELIDIDVYDNNEFNEYINELKDRVKTKIKEEIEKLGEEKLKGILYGFKQFLFQHLLGLSTLLSQQNIEGSQPPHIRNVGLDFGQ